MSTASVPQDQPNLICPECTDQFNKGDMRSFDKSDYDSFVDDFTCPSCREDIHPEDALFAYFRAAPTSELSGRPVQIGGFATVGTKKLDVGKTKEESLIGGGALDIDLALLAETDQPPGQTIRQLQGVTLEWYPGPQLINGTVVDIAQASDTEIGFITSDRNSSSSTLTVAYNVLIHRSEVPQPPWVTLLSDAITHYHRGQGLAMYSLLFSAFENLLSRELARTLRARGWWDTPIEDFLERYWRWDERCKGGLKKATSTHFPTQYPNLYQDLYDLRDTRNNEIIHVDPGDSVADISVSELKDAVETVMEASIAINEICYNKRQSI
jgi:hypothetical protein